MASIRTFLKSNKHLEVADEDSKDYSIEKIHSRRKGSRGTRLNKE
jgi:hypothetical protein